MTAPFRVKSLRTLDAYLETGIMKKDKDNIIYVDNLTEHSKYIRFAGTHKYIEIRREKDFPFGKVYKNE